MWPKPQEPADLVTFTEEILNEKLHFLCCECLYVRHLPQLQSIFIKKDKTLREKCPYVEFFWSIFSCILPEYGQILCITPYSVRIREKTGQKNSKYVHFSCSDSCSEKSHWNFKFCLISSRNVSWSHELVVPL